jgi:hypothetical protein
VDALIHALAQYRQLWIGLGIGSALMVAISVALVPWLIARAPVDYFVREHEPASSALAMTWFVVRQVLGVILLVLGVLLLVLPGQGVLTMLLGVSLIDLPGKQKVMLALVRRKAVANALSWLRKRAGKPDFELP